MRISCFILLALVCSCQGTGEGPKEGSLAKKPNDLNVVICNRILDFDACSSCCGDQISPWRDYLKGTLTGDKLRTGTQKLDEALSKCIGVCTAKIVTPLGEPILSPQDCGRLTASQDACVACCDDQSEQYFPGTRTAEQQEALDLLKDSCKLAECDVQQDY